MNKSVSYFKQGQYLFSEEGRHHGLYCIIYGEVNL